jgi:broad specificity phosphatase PhoE
MRTQFLPSFIRFPGGESYKDLIQRLQSVVVDLEQQVIPTLVVSHVSVLQMLIAYFRNSPVEKAMNIEVPLHTVIKFTPARGGGWSETQHPLAALYDKVDLDGSEYFQFDGIDQVAKDDGSPKSTPIWGDHMRKASSSET